MATIGKFAWASVPTYIAAQLIGAPLLGRLSDRFGRRPVLLVSVFGTFLGFLLRGFANALWMLFVSRIIDGLTGGFNFQSAWTTGWLAGGALASASLL